MKLQDTHNKILEYLYKHGSANTFKLSRGLKIERDKLIRMVNELSNKGLVKFRSGTVSKASNEKQDSLKVTESKEAEKPVKSKPLSKTPKKPKVPKEKYCELEKITKEIRLVYQMQREREKAEKELIGREHSVKEKEEAVSAAFKRIKREKEKISKARVLKKGIQELEATLEDLKKKVSTEKRKFEKSKKREIKSEVIPKERPVKKTPRNTEEIEKPKNEEIWPLKSVSKTETEKPKISPEELWQPTEISKEKVEDQFHDLIEEEISLLKQKRNGEARNIHSQIKDMINEVIDPDQRKAIIKDWNRVKYFY